MLQSSHSAEKDITKVIIGESGFDSAVLDIKGEYGMTQDSFGILFDNEEDGKKIHEFIKSDKFIKYYKESCIWSGFRIDWRLFQYFKKNFWKLLPVFKN